MKLFLTILFSFLMYGLNAQEEMTNYYLTQRSMSGGTPMSGTTTTLSYYFVVNNSIVMHHVKHENEALKLKKGDTLVVNLSSYRPYQNSSKREYTEIKPAKEFGSFFSKGKYYVNVKMPEEFDRAILYQFKKKKLICPKIKTEIDSQENSYAP